MLQAGNPVFQSELEICPSNPGDELQCVGRFHIYAYLPVSGVKYDMTTVNNVLQFTPSPVNGKILPQIVTIPFKIDFSDTAFTSDTVLPCMTPTPNASGPSPVPYLTIATNLLSQQALQKVEFIRPTKAACTVEQDGDCIKGTAEFQWLSYILNLSGAGGASVNIGQGPAGPINVGPFPVTGSTSVATGQGGLGPFTLNVSYEICYRDGCRTQTIPRDTATDAKSVFAAGGIP